MNRSGTRVLELGPGLSLVHDPGVHQGKTRGMDKGLFLSAGGRLCAGESAGIGLPVLKTGSRTVFPVCIRVEPRDARSLEKVFSLERTLQWQAAGVNAPHLVARVFERLADVFMKAPALQQPLLAVRDTLFRLFRMSSSMVAARPEGCCRVLYQASPQGLLVRVDGTSLEGKGTVILLNEVEGRAFNRLRTGGTLLEGRDIPAWQRASFACSLESGTLGLGLSLAPGPGHAPEDFRLSCGREQGRMLDWAGIALTCPKPVFSYRVLFARERTGAEGRCRAVRP
jgi:hypothetical protein